MPDTNETSKTSSNSTILKTVAGVAIGAAVALGAYFIGREEGQEEAKQSYQHRVQYAQNMTPKADKVDDDDEKISKDCVICKVSFKQLMNRDVELHSTPCGHIFCKSCIDASLSIYARCPICNEELLPGQTHRIYL
ncbi:hypothetical protein HA402_010674 [Bradysia odoriphaga]|nr:hypothetical protein HA402_010674 [Bradysia odoriphaga]